MFFVAGITGHIGGAAARELIARGKRVRALVRDLEKASDWADQGVQIQKGRSDRCGRSLGRVGRC